MTDKFIMKDHIVHLGTGTPEQNGLNLVDLSKTSKHEGPAGVGSKIAGNAGKDSNHEDRPLVKNEQVAPAGNNQVKPHTFSKITPTVPGKLEKTDHTLDMSVAEQFDTVHFLGMSAPAGTREGNEAWKAKQELLAMKENIMHGSDYDAIARGKLFDSLIVDFDRTIKPTAGETFSQRLDEFEHSVWMRAARGEQINK